MTSQTAYRFDPATSIFHELGEQPPAPHRIVAAESFRLIAGFAPRLTLHRRRFFTAAETQPDTDLITDDSWSAALAVLRTLSGPATETDLFPRLAVEVAQPDAAPELILRIRPAATPRETTTLLIPEAEDPRTVPTVKGPDIALLSEFSTTARSSAPQPQAADDVILHRDNHLLETSTATIFLARFPGLDQLPHLIFPDAAEILTSTTALHVAEKVTELGIGSVHHQPLTLDHLTDNVAVYVGNAHRGITPVTSLIDARTTPPVRLELPQAQQLTSQLRSVITQGFGPL